MTQTILYDQYVPEAHMTESIGTVADETVASIESYVTDWLSDDRAPGASVAIVENGETVYVEGFGARNLADNKPATPTTLYGIGSCSKSFTALAIMQLVTDGDLETDDLVDEYIPHLSGVESDPVTIHDLLTHSSGMPSDGSLTALISRLTGIENVEVPLSDDADFRRHVEGSVDERLPDEERFFYYNSGYTMLGRIVEEVSGQPYPEYVDEHIHEPLSMDHSTFSAEAFEDQPDRMTAYYRRDGDSDEAALPFDERLYAPGGMLSTVVDLTNYLRMNMNGGTFADVELLPADRLSEMHDRHATRGTYLDGTEDGYGYGWGIREYLNDTLVGHGGMMGTTTGYLGFLDETDIGVAIGCNAAPSRHPSVAGLATLAIMTGADPNEVVPRLALDRKFEPLTGEYESYRGIKTGTIEQEGGRLELTLENARSSSTIPLFPTSLDPDDHEFYTVVNSGQRVPVEFQTGEDVSVTYRRWRLHQQ